MFYFFQAVLNFHFLGNHEFVKCQNICVSLYLLTTPSYDCPFIVRDLMFSLGSLYFFL